MLFYGLLSLSLMEIAIYVGAAVIPAIFLMRYVYVNDLPQDREPAALLWRLALSGVYAALVAMVLEWIEDGLIIPAFHIQDKMTLLIVQMLFVGLTEEGCKLYFLKKRTWNNLNFNYTYDGMMYSVFVSLGFAAFENILYVFNYGLSVAFSRAIFAIPAHFGFSVIMGIMYARAKFCDSRGDGVGRTANMLLGYLLAVAMHAFYDTTASMNSNMGTGVFLIFVVIMYFVIYRLIKREARTDRPIY